jgi:Uncharacterized protein conserved in bacteria
MSINFEWSSKKAKANLAKHGVSFEEAATVFEDTAALIYPDPQHSDDELREFIIGYSLQGRILLVCFTERTHATRIINARQPDKNERRTYEEKDLR